MIPQAMERLSPCTPTTEPVLSSSWATATEPAHLEPALHNKRSHRSEKPGTAAKSSPTRCNEEKPARSNEDPAEPKNKKIRDYWDNVRGTLGAQKRALWVGRLD